MSYFREPRVERLTDCEYDQVDDQSSPCHNPGAAIDRANGIVVCLPHLDSLVSFINGINEDYDKEITARKEAELKELLETAKHDPNTPVVSIDPVHGDHAPFAPVGPSSEDRGD